MQIVKNIQADGAERSPCRPPCSITHGRASDRANDYVITNEISVTPAPPMVVRLTVDKYKTMLKAHQDLDSQHINYEAKNGTLILSGSVHTVHERAEAVELAKAVPHVERVVDEIKVERQGDQPL